MENQLEIIKKQLPFGYEKKIAKEVGCSQGTVHNILNSKHSERSSYKTQVINIATRMANEKLQVMKEAAKTAEDIKNIASNGIGD